MIGYAGLSDWLDGYVARKFDQGSVIGSYLDPLADKVLICCTVGALASEVLHPPIDVVPLMLFCTSEWEKQIFPVLI